LAIDFSPEALPCTCGSRGHLESYAGSAGVTRRLREAVASAGPAHRPAGLWKRLEQDDATPREIAELAESGDPACLGVVEETARYVGQAVGLLCQVIDPEAVLIGGAMTFGGAETRTGQRFLEVIHLTVRQSTLVQVGGNVLIGFASLGNDAGMLGAASIARQQVESAVEF
jgi:glucokinase